MNIFFTVMINVLLFLFELVVPSWKGKIHLCLNQEK